LDETYERILTEIKAPHRDNARRLLQCLVAAIRPLRVEELAEVLVIDFAVEGVPILNPRWRWEDQEQALLSSCSSLITIVDVDDSRVVQFSHSSVKEYLTSDRLATRSEDVSRYHILLEPAHTILAQACVSVLLRLALTTILLSHNMPPHTGFRMLSSRMSRHASKGWNISSTNTSLIFVRGSNCTISTRSPTPAPFSRCSSLSTSQKLPPSTTRLFVDSTTWPNRSSISIPKMWTPVVAIT